MISLSFHNLVKVELTNSREIILASTGVPFYSRSLRMVDKDGEAVTIDLYSAESTGLNLEETPP